MRIFQRRLAPREAPGDYPGAKPIAMKVIFRQSDGRLLGAQAVGEDGVDKRIGHLALAIQLGATVYDLEEAELCYSPPFGSAKDPVNFAGMVAAGVLRNDMPVRQWDALGDVFLLDVREPVESAVEVVPGAVNIPLGELRSRLDEVLRLDILAGRVFRDRILGDGGLSPLQHYELEGTVGAIAPIAGDDGWLLAANRGFVHLRPDGTTRSIAQVAPEGTRMNDAACDPQGRFWAGTLADDHRPGGGALYRLDGRGRTELLIDDLTISNGMGWSPDGATMYLVDSGPKHVYAFDFDGALGTITSQRILVDLDDGSAAPDGMTVDSSGDLWVALYGGWGVRRFSPDGDLQHTLDVPAEQTTCCAFCGPGLHQLYVTTATEGWTDERREAEPGAGLVYRLDTDATGTPATPYRPAGAWWETAGPV